MIGNVLDHARSDELAWGDEVLKAQQSYSVSFTVELTAPLVALLFDGPERLWWQMSQLYNPFWWRHDDIDDRVNWRATP